MKKHSQNFLLAVLLSSLFLNLNCKKDNGCLTCPQQQDTLSSIPTTEVKGPGGPAYLYGDIKDYICPSRVVTNTYIYLMSNANYNDTLLAVHVVSTNASFKLTNIPEGKVDLIVMNENYLCAKIGKLILKANGNSFYNHNSNGYFNDSTIYLTNIVDSIDRPDAPRQGIQGYGPGLVIHFKWETSDSLAWKIVQASGCDTLHVFRYDNPFIDPYENDVYYLKCKDIKTVFDKLLIFNWMKEVKDSDPVFEFIQQ